MKNTKIITKILKKNKLHTKRLRGAAANQGHNKYNRKTKLPFLEKGKKSGVHCSSTRDSREA
jgi:hypothetical protein